MNFADALNNFIAKRNIRSCDICDGIGVKKSWLSKVRCGAILPPDYSIIHKLALFLHLSESEHILLCAAYRKTCFSPDIAITDRRISRLLSFHADIALESGSAEVTCPLPENGTLLRSKQLKRVCTAVLHTAKFVYLFDAPTDTAQCADFCSLLSQTASESPIRWLIRLNSENNSAEGLNSITNILPLLIRHGAEIHCTKHCTDALNPFPLLLASDSCVLLLRSDGSEGLYLTGEAAGAYRDQLTGAFEAGEPYVHVTSSLSDLFGWFSDHVPDTEDDVYSITKSPWLVPAAPTTSIQKIMIEDTLFDSYMLMLRGVFFGVGILHECFWENGVHDLLYNEKYFEYGNNLTTSFSVESRHHIFRDAISEVQTNHEHDYGLFRTVFPEETDFLCLDLWTSGCVLIVLNVGETSFFLMMQDPDVTQALIRWLEAMRRHGLLTGKETAVSICEKMLHDAENETETTEP